MNPSAREIIESQVWRDAKAAAMRSLHDLFERTDPGEVETLQTIAHQLRAVQLMSNELERQMREPNINLRK